MQIPLEMAGKTKDRKQQNEAPTSHVEDSDGDTTPTKDNRTDTENDSDIEDLNSDTSDKAPGSLALDIQSAQNVLNDDSYTNTKTNPHSAQALLDKSLNPPDHVSKMNDLVAAATEKAARRKVRAIAKRAKKRQELAKAAKASASNKATSQSNDDDSSSSSSQSSSSSSDEEYGKKPKADKKKTKSNNTKGSQKLQQNTYAILNSTTPTKSNATSGLSKAARKRHKKIARTFRTFFCAKVKVKSSSNGMEELHKKTKQWYNYLRQVDETAIIYPFKDVNPTTALLSIENIPDSLAPFRNYFHQANPRSTEGHVWINMHVGHTEPVQDILREMGNYKNDTDTYTYAKKLQTRYVAKEYFLLWSTDYIDVAKLTEETHRRITEFTDVKYQFAFAWSEIKGLDGKKYTSDKKDRWRRNALSALHIQVPEESKNDTYDVMSKLFGLDTTKHVLGREMLMVPILKKTNTAHKNANIEKLIQKHAQFYAKLDHAQCTDFITVDQPCPPSNQTVREMLMELVTLDGRNTKLFWSIDADGDRGFIITFPSFVADEARNILAQLPSLLHHLKGVEVLSMMSAAAQNQALNAPWDTKRMCARSKMDERLDAMVIATAGMGETVESDLDDSDDDSIDTQMEIDGDPVREANEFLFHKASSNESVTTLDTRLGRTKATKSTIVHTIEGSPQKRQRHRSNLSKEELEEIRMEINNELDDSNLGAAMDSEPTQPDTLAPGPLEGSGAAL